MTCFHPQKIWVPKAWPTAPYTSPQQFDELKKAKFKWHDGIEKTHREIEIPCGHCLGCRLDHANMWATRCTLEAEQWKNNCVISLTYNDPHVHKNEKSGLLTLYKKDFQDFMKRLRFHNKGKEAWIHPISQKQEKPIRYFACGEYGRSGSRAPLGGNPHFHVILFNWKPSDLKFYKFNKHGDPIYTSKELQEIWGKGFVTVEDFNYNNACYVTRYVQKKAGIESKKRQYEDPGDIPPKEKVDIRTGEIYEYYPRKIKKEEELQEKEFLTMSRGVGIGVNYWIKNKEKVKRNKGILLKIKNTVKLKPIPRYYKKLWETENYREYYRYKYEIENNMLRKKAEIIAQVDLPDGTTDQVKYEFYLKNQEMILYEKARRGLQRNNFV